MSAPVVDRATWLRMKREPTVTLGSSSAAAACGMSSKRSAFVLYHEIRGDLPTEDLSDNRFVYYGNLFESVILRDCARKPFRFLAAKPSLCRPPALRLPHGCPAATPPG